MKREIWKLPISEKNLMIPVCRGILRATTRTSVTLSNATSDRHSMKHAEFIGGLMPLGTFIGAQ